MIKKLYLLTFFILVSSGFSLTKTPILTINRSFPADNTVHVARFFYERIQLDDPFHASEMVVKFHTQVDAKDLAVFAEPQSHSLVAESTNPGIVQLRKHIGQIISGLSKPCSTGIKLEFLNEQKNVSVLLEFTENDEKMTCDITLRGYSAVVPVELLNLFRAFLCDDSWIAKNWKRGVVATTVLGGSASVALLNRINIPFLRRRYCSFSERAIAKITSLAGEFKDFQMVPVNDSKKWIFLFRPMFGWQLRGSERSLSCLTMLGMMV